MEEVMAKNVKVLFLVTLTLGFIQGLFDLIFPFYLESRGMSLAGMGLLFTVSSCIDEFILIFLGDYSDRMGRKKIYSQSFLLGGVSSIFYSLGRGVADLSIIKIFSDISRTFRTSVSNVMVFENAPKGFARLVSYLRGSGLLIQAIGFFTAVYIMQWLGFSGCFWLIAALNFFSFAVVTIVYKEVTLKKKESQPPSSSSKIERLKQIYSFDISRTLKIVSVIGGFAGIGIQISHTFSLPLYFAGKYGLTGEALAIVLSVHRFAMITMLFSSRIIQRTGLRKIYPFSLLVYAFSFLGSALVNNIWIMVPIFLIHDIIGGSFRVPAYATLIQGYAREESRARDTDTSHFITAFMTMFAPVLAGSLATLNWDFLFFGGAAFMFTAAILFMVLIKEVPEELWEKRKARQ